MPAARALCYNLFAAIGKSIEVSNSKKDFHGDPYRKQALCDKALNFYEAKCQLDSGL